MKKLISIFLALALLGGSVISTGSLDAEVKMPEITLTAIDENTVYPISYAPSAAAELDYYRSDYMPDHLQSQGEYGTCWAFSTTALAEISLIKNGLADSSVDLSEAQVAYNVYHSFEDKLGLLGSDSLVNLSGTWLEDGGSLSHSIWSLAAWKGIADESVAPYAGVNDDTVLTYDQQHASSAILTDAKWFNMSQMITVKDMILQYGAISTSMYHYEGFFNSATNGYYQGSTSSTNHAITIVGWDDNYSADNFLTTPRGDGAWICRNSWGDWWGDSGYCYISYYDMAVSNAAAYALDFDKAENYNNNYQYDGGLFNGYASIPAGYGYYNNFTATEDEILSAVSIGLYSTDVWYSVMIYDVETGAELLTSPVEGMTSYSGYYTIELPEKVELKAGQEFSVYFSLQTSDGYAHIMVDASYADASFAYYADNKNAKSYFTYIYGEPAYTMSLSQSYDWCLRIKALTSPIEEPEPETEPGDVDGDGYVNLKDVFDLKSQITGSMPLTATADTNGDGSVNISDIFYIIRILLA